ncbi:hypothetical protein H8D36_00175 [archaeon]|nr:hypothetical protein [archaeon]MBL7057080.1 hypothetical protein [Candidatus Woesearchaeota archaeon]
MLCKQCNHGMKEVDQVNSGNSLFITYQCMHCANRTTQCKGLHNLSTI